MLLVKSYENQLKYHRVIQKIIRVTFLKQCRKTVHSLEMHIGAAVLRSGADNLLFFCRSLHVSCLYVSAVAPLRALQLCSITDVLRHHAVLQCIFIYCCAVRSCRC